MVKANKVEEPKVMGDKKAEEFYAEALKLLNKSRIPFMVGGTYAFSAHTGISRPTKDFDIFCKTGDYTKILEAFKHEKYQVEIIDARWLAKAYQKNHFIDIIFGSRTDQLPVDDTWFSHGPTVKVFDVPVKIIPAEEMLWSKMFIQHRDKYDGPDVNHLILRKGKVIDWKHLLMRMEAHWEIFLAHLINFRFVYPSERDTIPKWLMEELLEREKQQLNLPTPIDHICRGHLITDREYEIDDKEWGFRNVISKTYSDSIPHHE